MVPSLQKERLIVPLNRLRVRAIVLVHIIAWSGDNSMDPEEGAVHAKMRDEEIAGSQAEILLPVAENLNIAAHDIVTIISHGRAALSIFGNRKPGQNASHVCLRRKRESQLESLLSASTADAIARLPSVPVTVVS